MKYYSKEFRIFLTGLLTGYRKMLEQSLAANTDINYHLLANDTKKQIDEAAKILKPTAFNSTDKDFKKLQEDTEEYLRQMEKEYQEKEAELAKRYRKKDEDLQEREESLEKSYRKKDEDLREKEENLESDYQKKEKILRESIDAQVKARVEQEQKEQEKKIRSELAKQFEQEKKTMISVELLPKVLQEFLVANNYVSTAVPPVVPAATAPTVTNASPVVSAANTVPAVPTANVATTAKAVTASNAAEQKTEEAPAEEGDDGFITPDPKDNIG